MFVLVSLAQYQVQQISWFGTMNGSLADIGGHLEFWELYLFL